MAIVMIFGVFASFGMLPFSEGTAASAAPLSWTPAWQDSSITAPVWDQAIVNEAGNAGFGNLGTGSVDGGGGFNSVDNGEPKGNCLRLCVYMNTLGLMAWYDPDLQITAGVNSGKTVSQNLADKITAMVEADKADPSNPITGLMHTTVPTGRGGIGEWVDGTVAMSLALARHNPRVWGLLSPEVKERCDFIMSVLAISGNMLHNYHNEPIRDLSQIYEWYKAWNPNLTEGYVDMMIGIYYYFGGADQVNKIFDDFDVNYYLDTMEDYGYNIMRGYFYKNRRLMVEGVGGASVFVPLQGLPFTYEDLNTKSGTIMSGGKRGNEIPYNPIELYKSVAKVMYNRTGQSTFYSGGNKIAYIVNGTNSPYDGLLGMANELNSMDANGLRSDGGYVLDNWKTSIPAAATIRAFGDWTGEGVNDIESRMYVGSEDFLYKISAANGGYQGWQKGNASFFSENSDSTGWHAFTCVKEIWVKLLKDETGYEAVYTQSGATYSVALKAYNLNLTTADTVTAKLEIYNGSGGLVTTVEPAAFTVPAKTTSKLIGTLSYPSWQAGYTAKLIINGEETALVPPAPVYTPATPITPPPAATIPPMDKAPEKHIGMHDYIWAESFDTYANVTKINNHVKASQTLNVGKMSGTSFAGSGNWSAQAEASSFRVEYLYGGGAYQELGIRSAAAANAALQIPLSSLSGTYALEFRVRSTAGGIINVRSAGSDDVYKKIAVIGASTGGGKIVPASNDTAVAASETAANWSSKRDTTRAWKRVQISCDTVTGKFNLFVDGVKIAPGSFDAPLAGNVLKGFVFEVADKTGITEASGKSSLGIDDIKVYAVDSIDTVINDLVWAENFDQGVDAGGDPKWQYYRPSVQAAVGQPFNPVMSGASPLNHYAAGTVLNTSGFVGDGGGGNRFRTNRWLSTPAGDNPGVIAEGFSGNALKVPGTAGGSSGVMCEAWDDEIANRAVLFTGRVKFTSTPGTAGVQYVLYGSSIPNGLISFLNDGSIKAGFSSDAKTLPVRWKKDAWVYYEVYINKFTNEMAVSVWGDMTGGTFSTTGIFEQIGIANEFVTNVPLRLRLTSAANSTGTAVFIDDMATWLVDSYEMAGPGVVLPAANKLSISDINVYKKDGSYRISASVQNTNSTQQSVQFIAAVYDGNKLVSVKLLPQDVAANFSGILDFAYASASEIQTSHTIKVMVWDSNMVPYCKPEVKQVSNL